MARHELPISLAVMSFLWGFTAMAGESCIQSRGFREIVLGKVKNHELALCIRHPVYDFVSASCLKKAGCEAIRKYQGTRDLSDDFGPVGTPTHRKCVRLGGEALLIEYQDGARWVEGGLCRFSDGSVISVENHL